MSAASTPSATPTSSAAGQVIPETTTDAPVAGTAPECERMAR